MPDPVCEALIFCELDIIEAHTNKHTLVGIFESLASARFPFHTEHFFVHVIVANFVPSEHPARLVLNIRNPAGGSIVGSAGIPIEGARSPSRVPVTISARFAFNRVAFPSTGAFGVELFLNDELIGSRILEVHPLNPVPIPKPPVLNPPVPASPPRPIGGSPTVVAHSNPGTEPDAPSKTNGASAAVPSDSVPGTAVLGGDLNTLLAKTVEGLVRTGIEKQMKRDLPGALADYDRALGLDPKNLTALSNRGMVKAERTDLDGAIADYTKAISINPDLKEPRYNRALARSARGDFAGAIQDYDRAIAIDGKYIAALNNRGMVKYGLRDFDGAIADFDRALSLDPNYAIGYNNRAGAKIGKGDAAEALADYERAISLDPKYVDAYENRARIKAARGDIQGAAADRAKAAGLRSVTPGPGQVLVNRKVTVDSPFIIENPSIVFWNIIGESMAPLVANDRATLGPLFPKQAEGGREHTPYCNVLFIYGVLNAQGLIGTPAIPLRDVIKTTGAYIVVIATETNVEVVNDPGFGKSIKSDGSWQANLVLTVNRNGDAFARFYRNLFGLMMNGVTMPLAWSKLAPQGPVGHTDCPGGFVIFEVSHIAFKRSP
jgi:Tfp pilus assembly protein PilF